MKPKLLYCLALIGVLLILSFTVLKRESKNCSLIACTKIKEAPEQVEGSTTEFIFVESLTKYLVLSIKR